MPRYAPTMSQDDLRRMLIDQAVRHDYLEQYGPIDHASPDMTRIVHMLLMEELLDPVQKDWAKIDFSTENMDVVAEKVTPGGVPYLQIRAGGDWETPLACIVYFDGKKMRGYVPKGGNSYNHQAKSAFGNNGTDRAACVAQFGSRYDREDGPDDVEPDIAAVDHDIAARIEAKGTYAYLSKPIVSKAKEKAAKQAHIEKGQNLTGPITSDMIYAVISLAGGGSYVTFELRSSRRALKADEGDRVVGMPEIFDKKRPTQSDENVWYAPMDCYPLQTLAILEAVGFVKAPDNDLTMYRNARTVVIR